VCTEFPGCQGELWPESNFRGGFTLWREIGVDYEGGVLDYSSRVAIHMTHRLGALVVFVLLGVLSILLIKQPASRKSGSILGVVLLAQVALGIQNVVLHLPLANAVAHNGMAALLLAAILWPLYLSGRRAQ
jgi:cytochrome c oxidase assembly protein subunit 15